MKKTIILALVSVIALVVTVQADSVKAKKVEVKPIAQKTCPVMGGKINKKLFYEYKKQKIYVCCRGCIGAIKKNPAKYLKKVKSDIAATKKKDDGLKLSDFYSN